jgi:hypothetical protein
MAQGYSAEATGVLDGTTNPAGKFDGRVVNAKLRASRATLDLSLAAVAKNSGDTNVLCPLPAAKPAEVRVSIRACRSAPRRSRSATAPTRQVPAAATSTPRPTRRPSFEGWARRTMRRSTRYEDVL